MAVLISDSRNPNYTGKLSAPNGWYQCLASHLIGTFNEGRDISSEVFQSLSVQTGNALGVCVGIENISYGYVDTQTVRPICVYLWRTLGTCTLTGGTPGTVNYTNHSLSPGDEIQITTTGTLPTGLSSTAHYYVHTVINANSFTIATSPDGTQLSWTGGGSGTHTLHVVLRKKGKTLAEIADNISLFHGAYFSPFRFETPVPLSSSLTYRLSVAYSGSTGSTPSVIRWMMASNLQNSQMYAIWSDITASAVSNQDQLIVMDPIEIDTPFTFRGVTSSFSSLYGVCGVACPYPGGMQSPYTASIFINNSPTSSMELVFDGVFCLSSHANVRMGWPNNRVRNIVLRYKVTPAGGGTSRTGFGDLKCGNWHCGLRSGLLLYGEIPTNYQTRLLSHLQVNSTTASVEATNEFFKVGDRFHVFAGGLNDSANVAWIPSETPNVTGVIESPSGSIIYFNTPNPSIMRASGSYAYNLSTKWGIEIRSDRTNAAATAIMVGPAAFELSGVKLVNVQIQTGYMNNGLITIYDSTHCTTHSVENVACYSTANTNLGIALYGSANTPKIYRNYYVGYCSNHATLLNSSYYLGSTKLSTGTTYFSNSYSEGVQNGSVFTLPNFPSFFAELNDVYADNCNIAFNLNGIVKGKNISANRSRTGIQINLLNVSNLENISIDKCFHAFVIPANITAIKNRFKNLKLGLEYANTNFIGINNNSYFDITFENYSGSALIGSSNYSILPDNLPDSLIKFLNNSNLYHMTQQLYGYIEKCGPGLPDQTTYTSGSNKYGVKMVPTTPDNEHDWLFDVPTGDISGKDMIVGIWCKVSSSAYYSGTNYMLPQLRVYYDFDMIASSSAQANTDWQYLMVSFRPQTSAGKIKIELAVRSDAQLDGAVYWDDISILYPAGYALNLGGMDLWDNGYPVTPPINTSISAIDVWAIDPSLFGANSIGDHVYRKILTTSGYIALMNPG